jgi:transposase InsO family protein
MKRLHVSERRACKVLGQNRSGQRYVAKEREDEGPLTAAIIELASQYGRYGYRRITALLRHDGWRVNHKRVDNQNEVDSGLMMVLVSGNGQNTRTMFGPMTLFKIEPKMAALSRC